ncbi:PLP-dependent aminotransferase family protein [Salidesulfovibrio onnuriiensis]|uniref:MocR-like pyridoxine biosynthesis transcription factor PdxR n=1 Tax=Salidesulfovibrio onnuriiensis TaxID=2583823 RepID=UPI0011CCB004|nr:PLP-dependent aminotransferase family protein [Salidesulfovibrio onnuriiensis]
MRIPLDRESDQPLYRQISGHLRKGILSGALAPEFRLPAVRALSKALGVNRITVETAYAELEAEGLVDMRVGSGTFVLPSYVQPEEAAGSREWPGWQQELRDRLSGISFWEYSADPDMIRFNGGLGDSRFFPMDEFRKVMRDVLSRQGVEALEFGDVRGYGPLRENIASILGSQGIQTSAGNILITSGTQQSLSFVAVSMLRPGDAVVVESPTYSGALDLFRSLGARLVPVPMDEDGMRVGRLESLFREHSPKLIYTIPNFQNPTGACMSGARRRRLVALAERNGVPIFEDDYVGDLRYEGHAQPALKSLDCCGNVFYASSFSKMLMPGLRVGYLVAEGPAHDMLTEIKRLHVQSTSSLLQRAVHEYVSVGRYAAYLRKSRQVYRARRDAMLEALEWHLPGVTAAPCSGGLACWMRLPHGVSSTGLRARARREGVDFAPGPILFPEPGKGDSFMRLNFAAFGREIIDEGMQRLGRALHDLNG